MVGKMKILIYLKAECTELPIFLEEYEDMSYIPRIGEKILIGSRHSLYKVIDIIIDIEVDEIKIVVKDLMECAK